MATNYYQIGGEVNKTPYSGDDSSESIYNGIITTTAQTLAGASADTLELVICEIPAGVRVNGIKWATSAALTGSANLTATFVIRKKATNSIIGPNGQTNASGTLTNLSNAVVPLSGATVTLSGATQNSATIIPTAFEGVGKASTQEPYYLSMLLTSATGSAVVQASWVAFVGVLGEFVGTV